MKKIISLVLILLVLLPILSGVPAIAFDAGVAADAASFAEPVSAGSDKYYTTKTLLAVDFSKIKSDTSLSAAGVNYLDVDSGDSYGVSYVDDGLAYSSNTAKGYLVSSVKLNSSKSYVVDFTFRANPSAYIFQASGVIPSCTDVSAINNKTIDNSAFKIRPYSGKNLGIDAASYYSDPECTKLLGSALDAEATTAAMTRQEDIRVKLLIKNGEWEYGEVSISGKTYYVKTYFAENKTDAKRTGWTNYFGFQSWNAADVVFKNLTISECAKGSESTSFATVICHGNTYRVAAGTEIDPTVYSRGAVAVLCDGAYSLGTTPKATAGKTYEIISQSENTFVSPMFAGSTKYYGKNILQTVDFASIENDADLAAAGMVYLDAADNSYGITYSNEGLHYRTGNNEGFLISNVKMSENETYIVDFTVAAAPSARVFVASAAFPDRETISEEVGAHVDARAFKLRLLSESMLASDGSKYYTDPACTALFGDGARPDVAAQEAAVTNQKDVRVRLLFTGGTWQYGEVIVEGQTYYLKATTARTEQNGYFGFAGFGSVEVLFKNLTIFECEKNPSGHSFVKVGDKLYRAPASQTLSAVEYAPNGKKTVVFKDNGTYSQTVNTKSGGVYVVMSLDDVNLRSVGASVRLNTDSGLRFATSIDKDDVAFLDELKAQGQITSYSYGTIITYAKYAKELGGELTHAALDSFASEKGIESSYVDVVATAWYKETEDSYIFVGSIVNIDSENYGREYAPSGYLTVSMADGNTFTVYTEYSSINVRSVAYVAACAYYDGSVGYDDAQTQMLTAFIGDRKYKTVAMDGVCEYTVVYDAEDKVAKERAYEVADAFAVAGIQLSVESDAALVQGKAIYIGATSHELSKASEAYYINSQISCDDLGNLAVTGNLEVGIPRLIQKIRSIEYSLSKTLLLEDTFMGIFAEEGFGNAPKYTGGGVEELKYSFEKSNSYYILIHDATLTDYNKYLAKLVSEGYECYHSTTANGQKFDTYTDGYNILTLSYVAYYDPRTNADKIYDTPSNGNVKYMTIAIDCVENSALPERSPDIADIATEQLSTIETQCGYLLRLQDGRFVVFDGGYTAENAKTLYDMIVDQNVREGKPVIAAWFLTHGHGDHVGALFNFIATYSDSVEIEAFVHNLPAFEQYNGLNIVETYPKKESDALYSRSLQYYADIERFYPDSEIIVARAGQRFEFGDIDIDVLFTCENLYKKQMLDTNGSSVVYSITGKSGRMLVLGDLVDPEGGVLNAVYGSSLKCDLVQVAHHGYNNGNPDMYKSIDATYAIWTNSLETIRDGKKHIQSSNKRNKFDYKSVDANLIPSTSGPIVTLTENMTKADILALDVGLTE